MAVVVYHAEQAMPAMDQDALPVDRGAAGGAAPALGQKGAPGLVVQAPIL